MYEARIGQAQTRSVSRESTDAVAKQREEADIAAYESTLSTLEDLDKKVGGWVGG